MQWLMKITLYVVKKISCNLFDKPMNAERLIHVDLTPTNIEELLQKDGWVEGRLSSKHYAPQFSKSWSFLKKRIYIIEF